MSFGMELNQNQTIKLNLTPELRQGINILQYSSLELVDFLNQQEIENPMLEVKETSNHDFIAHNYEKSSLSSLNKESAYNQINNYSLSTVTLEEHLNEQIMTLHNITRLQKNILKFLITNLNNQGFLEIEPALTARIFSVNLEEVEKAVNILQKLDPIGVGAKNLKDCLLIQMRMRLKSHNSQLVYKIIGNHLEDIATKSYHKIAKIYHVTVQEVQKSADYIKTLNPRPCSNFYNEITQYVISDVIVENIKNEYLIIVNDSIMPNLSINEFYKNKLDTDSAGEAKEFLKAKYHEAIIIMNGITQRKLTLYKVTKAIIDNQKEFLQYGLSGLKPMTLRDISEQLDFHESTISRATSNKYIQTQHGLFKLKSLFTTGLRRANSLETDSSVAVKGKIKALIDNENKQKPISDQIIAKLLEQNGILVSRRTIAKYREEIGIPSSSKRKRF